ncbi:MAG TPA: hypothetical protein VIY53_05425 [Acidobacteriaceae bacterium]
MPEDSRDRRDAQATHGGLSWGLMLFIIGLALAVAIVIAWLFIHSFVIRH